MKFDEVNQSAAGRRALKIIKRLHDQGFTAVLAGGCVRDALMGDVPKDFDVATDATPDTVRNLFGRRHTLAFGASFGVIGVLDDQHTAADDRDVADDGDVAANNGDHSDKRHADAVPPTEVATFRSDGEYGDSRRPNSVRFGDARADAARRDFTVNGLFYDPIAERLIDYVGGLDDINDRILRTIGNPRDRFGEDHLRLLRALRFSVTKGLTIDRETLDAITDLADRATSVSGERIGQEMRRCLIGDYAGETLDRLRQTGLDKPILGSIDQSTTDRMRRRSRPNHRFEDSLALTLASGVNAPVQSLANIAKAWRLSNPEIRRVRFAIDTYPILLRRDAYWSAVQPILANRDGEAALMLAEAIANDDTTPSPPHLRRYREAMGWDRERLDPPPLVTGADLKRMNIPAGPRYKTILADIRAEQLDGTIATKDEAIAKIAESME